MQKSKKIILLTLFMLFITKSLFAGSYGTIAGKVYDQESGQPLLGANIILQGTQRGAISDSDGRFLLTQIIPGKYILEVRYIGYTSLILQNVMVTADYRTNVDLELTQGVITGPSILVTAKRPLIQKNVTGTIHFISAEKIRNLPIQSFVDIVDLQPGVAAGHIRGGRKNEVAYLIDDLPIADAISGEIASIIGKDAIADMTIQTGGYNAEYGNAMSGIVQVNMKSGGEKKEFSFRLYDTKYEDSNPFDNKSNQSIGSEIAVGGPIFNTTHRYFFSANYLYNEYVKLKESFGERKRISLDPNSWHWNTAIKLETDPTRSFHLKGQVLLSYWDWREYDHKWSLNLNRLPWQGKRSIRSHIVFVKRFSANIYYTLKLGQFRLIRQVFGKDILDLEPIQFQTTISWKIR